MKKKQIHLFQDLLILAISICFAIFVYRSGIAGDFVSFFAGHGLYWLGVFFAGMFFTSIFTTAPAIVLLVEFAQTTPLIPLVILGALGSVLGDYIIFFFVKNRVADDIKYLLSFSKGFRLPIIFQTRLFRYFVVLLGAMVIASPLPDEIGVAMLGLSKMNNRAFLAISFIFNALGILLITSIAKVVIGLN